MLFIVTPSFCPTTTHVFYPPCKRPDIYLPRIPTSCGHVTEDWLMRCFYLEFLNVSQSRMESGEYILVAMVPSSRLHSGPEVGLKVLLDAQTLFLLLGVDAYYWIHELTSSIKSFFLLLPARIHFCGYLK